MSADDWMHDAPLPIRLNGFGIGVREAMRMIEQVALRRDWDFEAMTIEAPYNVCAELIDHTPNTRVERRNGRNVILWQRPTGNIGFHGAAKGQTSLVVRLGGEPVMFLDGMA